jgi:hypothetical protein
MKIIVSLCGVMSLLAANGSAHAQGMDSEQKATLEAVISFYNTMAERGDPQAKAASERLKKAIQSGKVRFAALRSNANAEADPATGEITINRNYVGRLTTSDSDVFLHRADLGATLLHEFRHLDQSSYTTFGGRISGFIGLGNYAEQQGWREAFDGMTRWINSTHKLLREAERKGLSAREQVRLAQELKLLCDSWHNFRDSYPERKYGSIRVSDPNDPEGPEVSLSNALGQIERIRDYAKERIQIGKITAVPFDGIYDGQFSYLLFSGKISILIRGNNVNITLSLEGLDKDVKRHFDELRQAWGEPMKNEESAPTTIRLKGTINSDGILIARSDRGLTLKGSVINNQAKGGIFSSQYQSVPVGTWAAMRRSK